MIAGKRILIIDDDPKFQAILKCIFEAQGIVVEKALDLTKAYELMSSFKPDVIFLDLQLSEKEHGGHFLLERKKNPAWRNIPVFVCSANKNRRLLKRVFELGATDYVVKPIKQSWILQKLRKYFLDEKEAIYYFSEEEQSKTVQVECWGELVGIGETQCKINAPVSFNSTEEITLKLDGLSEASNIEGKNLVKLKDYFEKDRKGKVEKKSNPLSDGVYQTKCSILGVGETEASALRELKQKWRNVR
jgi:DNA-binding response OmpR family regulator